MSSAGLPLLNRAFLVEDEVLAAQRAIVDGRKAEAAEALRRAAAKAIELAADLDWEGER